MSDYFQGFTEDVPHPRMAATGTEGRCELCGLYDSELHERWYAAQPPYVPDPNAKTETIYADSDFPGRPSELEVATAFSDSVTLESDGENWHVVTKRAPCGLEILPETSGGFNHVGMQPGGHIAWHADYECPGPPPLS